MSPSFAVGAPGPSEPGAPFVRLRVAPAVETLVDADVAQALAGRSLSLAGRGYVCVRTHGRKRTSVYLHRLICPSGPGEDTHHRNQDILDNRRANLISVPRSMHRLIHRVRAGGQEFPGVVRFPCGRFAATIRMYKRSRTSVVLATSLLAALAGDDLLRAGGAPTEALAFPQEVPRDRVAEVLAASHSRFLRVWFVRREDGRLREMICRAGVKKGQSGTGLKFDPHERGLLSVYDVSAGQYRFIPLEGVIALRSGGLSYRVRESAHVQE